MIMWINFLEFLPNDSHIFTSFSNQGVGGLDGLSIGSNVVLQSVWGVTTALQVPPGYIINGVRICYQLSNTRSHIKGIRLGMLDDPPDSLIASDYLADLKDVGPKCVDIDGQANPNLNSIRLSFLLKFDNISDRILIRGVGLNLGISKV
jgi:hypothetical protein